MILSRWISIILWLAKIFSLLARYLRFAKLPKMNFILVVVAVAVAVAVAADVALPTQKVIAAAAVAVAMVAAATNFPDGLIFYLS